MSEQHPYSHDTQHMYHAAAPVNGTPDLYYGSSKASSPISPLSRTMSYVDNAGNVQNGYTTATSLPYSIPTESSYLTPPPGMIPVQLDIEGLYEDHDRRRKSSGDRDHDSVSSHRRRAQNRASQRAFRDRKEKHVKQLEDKLRDLENKNKDLSQSYESLQLEYTNVKQELERLSEENQSLRSTPTAHFAVPANERQFYPPQYKDSNPPLFDESMFSYEQPNEVPEVRGYPPRWIG